MKDDIDLTPECVYQHPGQPCWGPVADRGVSAVILTCTGHSQVPHSGLYYTEEEINQARLKGSRLRGLQLHPATDPGGGLPEELNGIWDDRPMPERFDDSEGFARAFKEFYYTHQPVNKPDKPPPVPEPVPPPVAAEKVRLVVDGTEDIPDEWKDYL